MLRKYHRFMISATVLVGLVWSLAFVLLVSQQKATPEVVPTLAALPTEEAPTAIVLPKTPLPVESPVAPKGDPPKSPLPVASSDESKGQPPATSQPNTVSLNTSPVNSLPITPAVPQNVVSAKPIALPLPQEPVANQIMMQFAPGTTAEQQEAYIQSIGGQVSRNLASLNAVVVRVPDSTKALPASPFVKVSEPDYYAVAQVDPSNDPFFADQWALPVIHAPEGWATLPSNTPDVIVAVVDSGICGDNVDLIGRVTSGWDFVQDDAVPQDEFGHGCSVAGVIAANGNNSIGIAGVAPNVKIMPIRVLDAQGVGTYSRVAAGIMYAVDHSASIINLSLGGASSSSVLQSAIDYAVAHHVLVIAAAGNTGNQTILFPASYEPVIAVGSVDRNLQRSAFSSSGAGIDLYAPGQEIVSTSLDGFSTLSGTSLAAPQVAGVAALDIALGKTLKIDGGIVSVTGYDSASPTATPQPTATTDTTATCNQSLVDEAQAALEDAIHQRTLGQATDSDVHDAGQAYLDTAAGCFAVAYQGSFSIDDGGHSASGDVTDQFVFNNTKWGAGSTGAAGNPPGIPGGTVTYSFMPDGVDLSPGAAYEEGAVKPGDVVEALSSLPGNSPTCNLEDRVEQAFATWSAVANIDFVRVADNGAPFNAPNGNVGDIRIGGHNIDGVGDQLAHAFFPPSVADSESGSGDLHFDAAENWGCTPGTDAEGRQVVDIGLVALHEIGHAIGLNHVQIDTALAIMNPTYNPDFVGPNGPILQPDDITGAKAIYGVRGFDSPVGLTPLGITQDNTPTFNWTAVASATQYQIQIGTEATYQNPLLDQIIGQDPNAQPGSGGNTTNEVPAEYTLITPLLNGDYLWRVRAFNQTLGGWGQWSGNSQFTVRIGVPALLSPLNGEAVRAGQVTFQWTTVFGDDPRFDWQIARLPDFASINLIKSVTGLAQPTYSMNLPDDNTYYWRVRANGGDWSTVRSFTIASNAPVPLSPTGGIVLDTNQVTFTWTPVDGATEYQYQIDTSPNFVGLLFLDNLFLNKLFLNKLFLNKLFLNKLSEDPLFLNKLFGDDLFLNKLFSDPLFLNKLFLNKLLLDKLFLNKIVDTSLELGKPLSEGIHYWRVRAHLADGTWGEWSSSASFVVDTPRSNVVINEVKIDDPSWIELYNSGIQSVDLSTWQFLVYLPDGEATFAYSFPDGFVIQPGAYVTLHEANGTNTTTDLYMGPNTIDWVIPDVGPLSTASAQSASTNIKLVQQNSLSDSASTPTTAEPTEQPQADNTAAAVQSTSPDSKATAEPTDTQIPPTVSSENTSINAQSLGSTDEGNVTAQDTFSINIGDTVSNGVPGAGAGNIETAGGNDVYTFTATAGQIVYFDALSGSSMTWRLVNPSNVQVFSQSISSDAGRQVLVAGTYTLTVTANSGVTGTYSFILRTVTDNTFSINIGDTVSNGVPGTGAGNIENPGNHDVYTFTGTAGQVVYFDAISTSASLYWTVTSPTNTTIFNNYYLGNDGGRIALPTSGTYTITVAASSTTSTTTGTYSFKLWNVAAPQTFPIAIGNTVSDGVPSAGAGNIETPGAQDVYTFTGTAGQVVYFDALSASDSLYWTVTSPTNTTIFNNYYLGYNDGGRIVLPTSGTYTITVAAYSSTYDDAGTYSFKLWAVTDNTFAINIGDTISDGVPGTGAGNIENPGNHDVYTFTGTAGQVVYFDALSASDSLYWTVTSPTNATLFNRYYLGYNDGGQIVLPTSGTYTITVAAYDTTYDDSGTYSFKLWNVAAPQTFPIAIGNTVSDGVPGTGAGNIETPGAQDVYTFTGTAGQNVYFDAISATDSLYWTVTSPTNATLFNRYNLQYSDGGRITLPTTGTYTITVAAYGPTYDDAGTYSFKLWAVTDNTFAINIGDTVSDGVPGTGAGNIETPGSQDTYTFSGTAGQVIYLDTISNSLGSSGYLEVRDPANNQLDYYYSTYDIGRLTLPTSGTYTIRFYSPNSTIGTYSFKLWNVPAPQTFTIAIGDTVSDGVPGAGAGDIETPGAQDVYTFTGTAGQNIFFDGLASSTDYSLYWTLTSPSNVTLFDTYIEYDGGQFILSETGTYTITVAPYGNTSDDVGTYSFKLWTVPAPQTFAINIGDLVAPDVPAAGAGYLESPGAQDVYTFTGTAGQSVFFDGIANSSNSLLYWTLTSPSNVTLFTTSVNSDGGQLTLSETGTYTIKVYDYYLSYNYYSGNTGPYSFRISTASSTEFALAMGSTVSNGSPATGAGNISPAGNVDTYVFGAQAGQSINLVVQSGTSSNLSWRLNAPNGTEIFNTGYTTQNNVSLPSSGTYRLTVQASASNPSFTGTYGFQLVPIVAPQTFAITIGDTVSNGIPSIGAGNLETYGSQDVYTFNGSAGQTVFFEPISNNTYDGYWRLTSPSNATLFNTYFSSSGIRQVLPSNGTYSLTFYDYFNRPGSYGFKLVGVATTQTYPISIGSTVSVDIPSAGAGILSKPGEQDNYTFTGTAGQTVFFDYLSTSQSYMYWRLTAPNNTIIFDQNMTSSGTRQALTQTGTYTLSVYNYYGYTGSYSFKLWDANAPQTFAISIGDTVSNGTPSAGAGNIESPGAQDIYTFSATAGQTLHFDTLGTTSSSIYWRLTSPTNVQIFNTSLSNDGGRQKLTETGTYTITVSANGDTTGTYSFKLRSIAAPQIFAISLGDTVSNGVPDTGAGNIETTGSEDLYTFTATAGQQLYFESISTNNSSLTWALYSPSDSLIFTQSVYSSYGAVTINTTGTYSLYVYGGDGETGTYSFKLWEVAEPETFNINVGDVVSKDIPTIGAGNLEGPGSEDIYTFTLADSQTLYFDVLAPLNYNFYWRLTNASNSTIFSGYMNTDAGQYTLPAGTYTLTVNSYYDYYGTYSFRIAPNSGDFVIAIGDTVSNGSPTTGAGNIDVAGNTDIYVFTGTQGQYITLDALTGSSSNLQWRLIGPSSTSLFNTSFSDQTNLLLSSTGTYTLTVQASTGNPNFTGTYSFHLIENIPPTSYGIAIGDTVSNGVPDIGAGIIEKTGNIDTYTFNGTAGQVVNFDAISNNVTGSGNILTWSLADHTGTAVFGFSSQNFQDVNGVTLTSTDIYTLKVQTYFGTGMGTYSFKLWNVPRETFSIAIGNTVSNGVPQAGAGNIEASGAIDNYTFSGTAGQTVNFDAITNNVAGGVLVWSLADHTGTAVSGFGSQTFQDLNNITLPANDTYTLKVQTDTGLGTGTYSFQITSVNSDSLQPGPTYTVNTTSIHDDGMCGTIDCTLIEAINAANALPDTNTITLGTSQTYTLTTPYLTQTVGLPQIVTPVVIQANSSTIERSAADDVPFGLFSVSATGRLTLNNITLRGGYAEAGGALNNSGGTITIRSSTITGNRSSANGGAYYGGGTLTISSSTFSNNTGSVGGAIYSSGVYTVTIDATTFSGNSATTGAGALYADGGTTTLIRSGSVFTNNSSVQGSAIMNNGAASTLTISNSTVSGNTSSSATGSGAVDNRLGTVNINNSSFVGNTAAGFGGALYNSSGGTLTVVTSNFETNTAGQDGGAIYNDASTLTVKDDDNPNTNTQTTFTSNKTTGGAGGAIASVGSTVNISDTTFFTNSAAAGRGGAILNGANNTLNLSRVTLAVNTALNEGGAIASPGSLTADHTRFDNNSVSGPDSTGGGLDSSGSLTITDSTFINNSAYTGGGLYQDVADATISGTTFTTNIATSNGGALLIAGGTTSITNSELDGNRSTAGTGAGLFVNAGSTAAITNVIFKENIANGVTSGSPQGGGAIGTLGTVTVTSANFESNQGQMGGALLVLSDATATITNSAFKGNQAINNGSGGGLYNYQGSASITNTTFANNNTSGFGGAIGTDSANGLTLTNVTIANNSITGGTNSSGGIYAAQGTVDIRNSIIANNTPDNCAVGTGDFTVTTSLQFPGPASCGDATVLDPQLGALTGSPAFFSLLPGSPAIDAATNTFCPPKDQRGLPRGFNSYGAVDSPAVGDCDIGAIEVFNMNLSNAGTQVGTIGGGAALINVLTGEDFVQFGDTNLIPPQGTNWTGGTPELPHAGQTLGRDPSSSDTDDRTDWSEQAPTMGGQNGIKVVINEIFPGAVDAVELYNSSVETVRMDGWKLFTYNANGAMEVNYTFGHFSLAPNAYVVLREGSGTNDAANLYLNTSISWADWNARGAVALTNGEGGIDFVRFGNSDTVVPQSEDGPIAQATTSVIQPPDGTHWTGEDPISPLPNQSLGRDSESTDMDDGSDWFSQAPSLGLKNPLIRPAVNDDFNNAIVVLQLPFRNTQTTFNTVRADVTDPTPSCGFNVGHTIWYQYTAQNDGTVRFQTDGSDFNTVMAIYVNTANGLNPIACDDDSGEGQRSRIDLQMSAGTTYYFMIGGVDYASGNAVFSGMPPVNDDFDDAISVTALPFSDSQNTTAAAQPFDDPTPDCGISIGRSVWYSFAATSDARVAFSTTGSDFDTVVSVWTGTRGHLVEVGCNDDNGFSLTSSVNLRTIPGTTYYIMVAGNQGAGGHLVFTADLLARPVNDFFANPTVISEPLPYRNQIDTTGATNEPLDTANLTCGISVGDTVWYSYTPSTDRTVIFTTNGSSFDTILAVWTNINQPPIACNDDAPASFYSTVTLNVTANTTYYIMVGGYGNTGGNLMFKAFSPAAPPANDERAGAIEISPLPFTFNADVTGATTASDDPTPSCSGPLGTTVWFHLSPMTAATQLRLQTAGSDYDTVMAVFANVPGGLVELACNDDSQQGRQSLIVTNINANTDVYVMVGDYSGTGGNLVFKASVNDINQRPDNDVFENATQITALPYSRSQSTLNATTAPDDPVPSCGTSVGSSVWYAFTATSSGILRLQTAGSDFDTVLSVYTGTRGHLTEVACGDDTSANLTSQVEFTPVVGTTYSIMVAGNGGLAGNLTLHAEQFTPPTNDDFDNASQVTLDGLNHYTATQQTNGATRAGDDPATACNTTATNTVWYSFTAPTAGTLSVSTQGSDFNTVLAVFTGTRGNLTAVGCDDNSGTNLTARLDSISVTSGTTYFIMIGGAFGQTGSLALDVALLPVPSNDDFDNAIQITGLPYTNTQDTTGATTASDDLAACNAAPTKTVWYSYTTTDTSDLLHLRLDGTTFKTVLAVYTGTRGNLTQLGCQIGSGLDLATSPNTTYFIMIGGFGGASGTLNIQANEVSLIANDDFDSAIDITTLPYSNTQDTTNASSAADDPLTCTPSVGKSVWYQFSAVETGTLRLTLNGTDYNTVLSVYTGTRGQLTPVACALFKGVDVPVVAGTTYYIGVFGYENAGGTLSLQAGRPGSLTITQTANPAVVVTPGGDVTFTVQVTNTSLTDVLTVTGLTNDVYQDLNGKGTCATPQTIAVGSAYTCSFTVPVTGNAGDTLSNTTTVTATDQANKVLNGSVTTHVGITNGNPIASDDTYSVDEDMTLTIAAPGVMTNDVDPNGDTLSAILVSDVTHGTLALAQDGSFTYTPAANFNGSDSFTYKVNDGTADSNVATVNIAVNAVNDAPTAVIMSPVAGTVTAGSNGFASVVLNSSGTTDVEDTLDQLSFEWSWMENGNPVTITAAGTVYNFPVGTYTITLKVTDSGGLTATQSVTLTVVAPPNQAPTVDAGSDATITLPVNSLSLNGSASDDGLPFGSTLTTTWSGPVGVTFADAHALNTSATFSAAGTYVLTLTASDGDQSVSDTVSITVNPAPVPPTANAGVDQAVTDSDNSGSEPVMLDGSGSTPAASITSYLWTENGTQIATGINPQVSLTVGAHTITLVVTDNAGLQGIDTVVVNVLPGTSTTLTANAGVDQAVTDSDNSGSEPVTLDGSGSTPAASITNYLWTENGAQIATGATPTVSLAVGTHTITLVVTDNHGAQASDTVVITVNAASSSDTVNAQVKASGDDVNQDGNSLVTNTSTVWFGTGSSTSSSYTGLRFNNISIPQGATINAAQLQVYSSANMWIRVNVTIKADAADNSPTFTNATRPSTRTLTSAQVVSSTNLQWQANTWYSYDGLAAVIQEITSRAGWQRGNSLSLILKGSGGAYSRKFMTSFDSNPAFAPRLVISYTTTAPLPPPTANAGADQSVFDSDNNGSEAVMLNGTASTPIGSIASYVWSENGVQIATGAAPTVPLAVGTHTITLVVTDNHGAQASDTVVITVNAASISNTVTSQVNGSSDDVNQDGNSLVTNASSLWFGTGSSTGSSYTGLRFNNINIPQGATINAAQLQVYSSANMWITVNVTIKADAADNSPTFTNTTSPSTRSLTGAQAVSNTNLQWQANTWYTYDGLAAVVQEVTNRAGWQSGNSLSLIIKGGGSAFGRKFISSFDSNPAFAPRLTIAYSPAAPVAPTAPTVQPPTAAFNANVAQGTAPLAVQFTNQSTGSGLSYSWNFGDGTTSTDINPSYTFNTAGTYTVVLVATNSAGSSSAQTVITVNAPVQSPTAAFTSDALSGTAPLAIQFANQSTGDNLSYSWNFGDGASSTDINPSHTFNTAGTYAILLTVSNSAGSATSQVSIQVSEPLPPPETTPDPGS